jgi:hypothetical protein
LFKIYVVSTDTNRTILSAMAHMAGMYSNGQTNIDYPGDAQNNSQWPSNWLPIPVHTVAERTDHVSRL